MSSRELLLNAFEMHTVGHLAHGLWRHPRDRARQHASVHSWQQLARTLEAGLFDGLFLADVGGVYDVYGGNADAALRHAIQLPVHDPVPLIPAMAAVTEHLGFGVTVNLSQELPHVFARRMSTLDHLSGGRLGWNIVTGFLDSAARATGAPTQARHDDRYARADEFMDVVYQLWEASWADDAVRADAAGGLYTDPARVRRIQHQGDWYRVDGIHLTEPSPQRTPVLYQAGASARGTAFAARHAECIFLPNQGVEATAALVRTLRQRLADAGRPRDAVRVLTSLEVIVAPTEAEARDKAAEYARYAQPEAALAQYAAATGIDFARYGLDEPIAVAGGPGGQGIQSAHDAVARGNAAGHWTVRRLLADMRYGGRFTPLVGSPTQVAQAMLAWADAADIDGFNLVRTVTPECFEDFARLVVPELQARGRFKTAYRTGTLREKLFGAGQPRLPAHHTGAQWRTAFQP